MNEANQLAYKKDDIPIVAVPGTAAPGDFDFAATALEQGKGRRVITF